MRGVMHILFLSCLKATACSGFEEQSVLLDKGISKIDAIDFAEGEIAQLKLMIIQKLKHLK